MTDGAQGDYRCVICITEYFRITVVESCCIRQDSHLICWRAIPVTYIDTRLAHVFPGKQLEYGF
jgi:hypothetical protein